ncbi:hypothetical protein [Myroides odoratus]|uniref:Uncharacterized protein n=1 Tax=Myroides odoratus TaxID=256 RepID=A0A9Q7ECE8_MYROD|nr:hypothetical protein [Myroides odoratus]EHQ44254.1 hypothetical protein Myrod_3450 [Myroides odoratus DSM 2801]EKB05851.1 hypothetical protein HMPREF9716_02644 [Myroides odoratus CIP 103059]QQU01535.1 hypothetical protein I6I88_07290 [Myroides odoratus]WQD56195.1 hypothetical protein U0010_11720 [Myroides odoratus]STZ31591.1 Uncharacterised protein [Myroides odoratus]
MTANELNSIAEKALEEKYNLIIASLKKCASEGKSSCILEELPDILINKLIAKGYRITPIVRYKSYFIFQKKKVKVYKIQF